MDQTAPETVLTSYEIPSDVTLFPNNPFLERKRGDLQNRLAYGLLNHADLTSLFTDPPPTFPVTYGSGDGPRHDIRVLMSELEEVYGEAPAVSLRAIRSLMTRVLAKYDTPYAKARLVSLLWDLADQNSFRDADQLLVSAERKEPLTDGLSPVFSMQGITDFESFVDSLNDREYLAQVSETSRQEVLTVAISYKHERHATHKLSSKHLAELKTALPKLAQELGVETFQIWIDRILSAKGELGDRSWWKIGLAPFLELPVLYVSGSDRSDAALIREMDTMWLNIERVAACIGLGMVSYGKRFDREQLPLHGIVFENARISQFDWWICEGKPGTALQERMRSLLFAMGNTTMLQRETYFTEDRNLLLNEAYRTFSKPQEVVRVQPVTNYTMRDDVIWCKRDLEEPSWLGAAEWCVNFVEDEECASSGTIQDAASLLEEEATFREFSIRNELSNVQKWIVLCPESVEPCVALALQIVQERVVLRATVVIDSPIEFLQWSATGVSSEAITEMLRRCGVLNDGETLEELRPLSSGDQVLVKRFT